MKLNVQVATWLHAQVVACATFEQVHGPLAKQGFSEVQVRKLYNAVLANPGALGAELARVAAGHAPVPQALATGLVQASVPANGGEAAPFVPAAAIPDDCGNVIACDHGDVRIAFRCRRPHVVVFDNVLTHDECDALMAEARPQLKRADVVDSEKGGSRVDDRRTSELVTIRRQHSPLAARIDARIATLTGVPVPRGEPLQVMRYGVGAEYRAHFDYFHLERPGEAALLTLGGQRVASLVMYLNDVEAGGETTFPRAGFAVGPRKGSAVYFAYTDASSRVDPMSFHAGAPVTRGEKWIATRWMRERDFPTA